MADIAVDSLVKKIEKDLLVAIIENVKQNRMSREQAQKLAKEFLTLLPMQDKHDLLQKLGKFSKLHIEGKSLYMKYGAPIEDEERKNKLELMSQHLQNGQIEHAINVAKGGTPNVV